MFVWINNIFITFNKIDICDILLGVFLKRWNYKICKAKFKKRC